MPANSHTPRIRTLLRQADRVAAANKRSAAIQLYREILEEAPDTAEAWAGLAGVTTDPAEKEKATRRALQLDPNSMEKEPGAESQTGRDGDSSDDPETHSVRERSSTTERKISRATLPSSPPSSKTNQGSRVEASGGTEHEPQVVNEVLTCVNHPGRKTNLRCNKCGQPICSKCAKPTPVGYRCYQCIKEHEDIYYSATLVHYAIATAVSFPLSILAGWFATFLGFWVIFLAAFAGSVIGRVTFWAVGRRRGRWLPHLVAGIIVLGAGLIALLLFLGQPSFRFIWTALYAIIAYGSAYYQMK